MVARGFSLALLNRGVHAALATSSHGPNGGVADSLDEAIGLCLDDLRFLDLRCGTGGCDLK
jgi:hypothetical protein